MLINFKLFVVYVFFVCVWLYEGTSLKRRLKIEGISITILKYMNILVMLKID